MNPKLVTVLLLALCLAGAVDGAAQPYRLHTVQYPGAISNAVVAVNDAGVAVGNAYFSNIQRGFIFDRDTFLTFHPFGGTSSGALGINRAGVAYGWAHGVGD